MRVSSRSPFSKGWMCSLVVPALTSSLLCVAGPKSAATAAVADCAPLWAERAGQPNDPRYDFTRDTAAKAGDGNYGYADTYLKRTGLKRTACQKEWTVLVYMAADNDLTPYALSNLYEMEAGYFQAKDAAGSTGRSDVLVQLDTAGANGIRRYQMFQRPEKFRSVPFADFSQWNLGKIKSPIVSFEAERPTGPGAGAGVGARAPSGGERFSKFIEWGVRNYPARHYMVIVWGHGQGYAVAQWRLQNSKSSLVGQKPTWGGVGGDASDDSYLGIADLEAGLRTVRRLTGSTVDVYASDACLMQTAEVASMLTKEARFIAGSVQIQDFLGLPYRRILYELNQATFALKPAALQALTPSERRDEARLVATMIPRLARSSMDPEKGLHGMLRASGIETMTSATFAGQTLREQVVGAIYRLGGALDAYLAKRPTRVGTVRYYLGKVTSFEGSALDFGFLLGVIRATLNDERELGAGAPAEAQRLAQAADTLERVFTAARVGLAVGTDYAEGIDLEGVRANVIGMSAWVPQTRAEYDERIAFMRTSLLFRFQPKDPVNGETYDWNRWLERVVQ